MQGRRGTMIKRLGGRALGSAGLWIVLTEGDVRSPLLAVLAILAGVATAAHTGVGSGWHIRFRGLPRFIGFFLRASFVGGVDVALRAFRSRAALDPALVRHALQLPPNSPAQALFTAVANLLPGTVCAAIDGPHVTIHVIDQRMDWRAVLDRLEQRISALMAPSVNGGVGS
jgi:multicomponent Na+:H+ antiporter subunit E